MSDTPIIVERLSKRYRISQAEARPATTGAALAGLLRAPFRYLREMSRPPTEAEVLWALRDVSFQVRRGEVLGIIGRNGAGKSTLLKILSRITDPTAGRAIITGRVGSLLEVGTGFNQELNGRENIYLSGTILGMKRAEIDRKFDEIVAFAGVEKFLDTPVKRYSSGMNVRLGFAVAAHLEPEILIVDEVLSVGDAGFQRKSLGKMENIAGEGRTVLFVSHSMPAIQAFCHRVILMDNGQIAGEGTAEAMTSQYLSEAELTEAGEVDLREHPRRTTPLDQRVLTRLRLRDAQGRIASAFQMGEQVTFELRLDLGTRVLHNPIITFNLRKQGLNIGTVSTRFMEARPFSLSGPAVARCTWDLGPLAPGLYRIADVMVKVQSGGPRLDAVEDVAAFEVLPRDVFGTGRLPVDNQLFVPTGRWSFAPADERLAPPVLNR
jgi:lipopolysaccharide transport system ATP-binding protein